MLQATAKLAIAFVVLYPFIAQPSWTPHSDPLAVHPPASESAARTPRAPKTLQDGVYVRIVDVGAGLCGIVRIPAGPGESAPHYVIYDAGHWNSTAVEATTDALDEIIPAGAVIDFMILSHTDSDHLGAVPDICNAYSVRRIVHSGMTRTPDTWVHANDAINRERDLGGCQDMNLGTVEVAPGSTFRMGDAFLTIVCAFNEPPSSWGTLSLSEFRNAGSIVARLYYQGRSVLFCGDTVGRHNGDPADACIAAEKFMVDHAPVVTIRSDVIIAPHHGADNGSSRSFIDAVHPEFVVFSCGHNYDHPRKATADRYLASGVSVEKMFRTDLGDDEGSAEWEQGRIAGHHDSVGDDDVEISISPQGTVEVKYRLPH